MIELPAERGPDLRAGRFVTSLRCGRALSPKQMADLCGVSEGAIRNVEKGTYPHLSTQERIAAFFGMTKEQIWRDPRPPIAQRRTVSEKALDAVSAAREDLRAMEAVAGAAPEDALALGVAWAVIRLQRPFALDVTDRALEAVEAWHGRVAP